MQKISGWEVAGGGNKALVSLHDASVQKGETVLATLVSPRRWQAQLAVKHLQGGEVRVQVGRAKAKDAQTALTNLGFDWASFPSAGAAAAGVFSGTLSPAQCRWRKVSDTERLVHIDLTPFKLAKRPRCILVSPVSEGGWQLSCHVSNASAQGFDVVAGRFETSEASRVAELFDSGTIGVSWAAFTTTPPGCECGFVMPEDWKASSRTKMWTSIAFRKKFPERPTVLVTPLSPVDSTQYNLVTTGTTASHVNVQIGRYAPLTAEGLDKAGIGLYYFCIGGRRPPFPSGNIMAPVVLSDDKDVQFGKKLGEGAFGTVHRARWAGTDVAVKRLKNANANLLSDMIKEMLLFQAARSPFVVKMHAVCLTPPMLILELCDETLESFIKRMGGKPPSVKVSATLACHMAMGGAFLHSRDPLILHRDIKPANVLIKDGRAKLGDLGIAREGLNANMTLIGTQWYLAPEFLTGAYGLPLDVYAFGLTSYELFRGKLITPGYDNFRPLLPLRSASKPIRWELHMQNVPREVLHLVEKALHPTASHRISFAKAVQFLAGIIQ